MSERKKYAVSTTVDLSKVTGGYGSIRDPFACPKCGGKMISESLGMKCLNCRGILNAKGEFHEYVERPFMPPMRRIDKIRTMSIDELVDWAFKNTACQLCSRNDRATCVDIEGGCKKYIKAWFEEELKEDENRT